MNCGFVDHFWTGLQLPGPGWPVAWPFACCGEAPLSRAENRLERPQRAANNAQNIMASNLLVMASNLVASIATNSVGPSCYGISQPRVYNESSQFYRLCWATWGEILSAKQLFLFFTARRPSCSGCNLPTHSAVRGMPGPPLLKTHHFYLSATNKCVEQVLLGPRGKPPSMERSALKLNIYPKKS